MKNLVKTTLSFSQKDVLKSIKGGWAISIHNSKLCLENEKTIFVPAYMMKPY
jgi:hypothetical protein